MPQLCPISAFFPNSVPKKFQLLLDFSPTITNLYPDYARTMQRQITENAQRFGPSCVPIVIIGR